MNQAALKPENIPFDSFVEANAALCDKLQQLPIGSHSESMMLGDLLQEAIELQGRMFAALRSKVASTQGAITKMRQELTTHKKLNAFDAIYEALKRAKWHLEDRNEQDGETYEMVAAALALAEATE